MALTSFVGTVLGAEVPQCSLNVALTSFRPVSEFRCGPVTIHWSYLDLSRSERNFAFEREGVFVLVDGWSAHPNCPNSSDSTVATSSFGRVVFDSYRQWEETFADHIEGEFSIVIWDAKLGRLLLARDIAGTKPLHWAKLTNGGIVFGSFAASVLAHPAVSHRISAGAVAAFIQGAHRKPELSFFDEVQRIPRASCLVWREQRVNVKQYFRPKWLGTSDDDVGSTIKFRKAVDDAVRMRAEPSGFAVTLSGGIDSSTVTAFAANQGWPISAITIDGGDEPATRDLSAAAKVIDRWKVPWYKVPIPTNFDFVDWIRMEDEPTVLPWLLVAVPCAKFAKKLGLSVLFSGAFGDVSGGNPTRVEDWLVRERCWKMLFRRYDKLPPTRRILAALYASIGVYSPTLSQFIRPITRQAHLQFQTQRILCPNIERSGSIADLRKYDGRREWHWEAFDWMANCEDAGEFSVFSSIERKIGIEFRHPLAARNVVELGAGVPWSLRFDRHRSRLLIRNAARHLLPSEVAGRKDKSFFGESFGKVYERAIPELMLHFHKDIWHYIDRESFERFRCNESIASTYRRFTVFRVAALAAWMNHFKLGCIV